MTFTARLHIQGVACYKRVDQDGKMPLMVLFPNGTFPPKDVCVHFSTLQFKLESLKPEGTENRAPVDSWVTHMIDHEDIRIETGSSVDMPEPELEHLPPIDQAIPARFASARKISESLLGDYNSAYTSADAKDRRGKSRILGRLLLDRGQVESHEEDRYKGTWSFDSATAGTTWSNTTTVVYEGVEEFIINIDRGTSTTRPVPLFPSGGFLEVWIRNVCDGFPPEAPWDSEYKLPVEEYDDTDFVLNYRVSQSFLQVTGGTGPAETFSRIPRVVDPDHVGIPSQKCMGSRW